MKTKKFLSTFLSMLLITVTIISFSSIPVSAKVTVLYTPPFEDHDHWYTGIGGSATYGTYVLGYLNSANKHLDFIYEDGIATVFPTGRSIIDRSYWEGSWVGYIDMTYVYEEPIEIDLNQAVFEYDIETIKEWSVKLYFQDINGNEHPAAFSLSYPLNIVAGDGINGLGGKYKGSFNMLEAIQKYYLTQKKEWGLTLDSKVRITKIAIMHNDYQGYDGRDFKDLEKDIYRKLRIVKDTSQPDIFKPVTTEEPNQTSTTASTTGITTITTTVPVTSGTVGTGTTTEAPNDGPVIGKPFYRQPLFIVLIIVAAVIVLGAVVLFVIKVLPKIKSKSKTE